MELREDFQKLMEKQLSDWKAQAERFKVSVEKLEAHNDGLFDKHLEILRVTQADASESFIKLKSANGSTWSEFKAYMEQAGLEVKAVVESMTTSLRH